MMNENELFNEQLNNVNVIKEQIDDLVNNMMDHIKDTFTSNKYLLEGLAEEQLNLLFLEMIKKKIIFNMT